ncbi:hypothetical protein O181_025616 [Austropuccinia psidii MF-1]|uniref:Uncharacterized protein n=1 Tax=Austropuccinia psidii MF-1 TaxID=1389203 RepID=A0A9Q3CNS5_9BASI|nr:hypothetical protein [Austropuccinia psidii MF-1]
MSPAHLRNLGIPRNKSEDREGLFRTRRLGRGHLGHSGGWQYTEGNHTHSAIHLPIEQKPQTRGLEGYGSSSSAAPTAQRSFPTYNGKQEVQPSMPLGRTWRMLPEDMSQRDTLQRPYGHHYWMESQQEVHTPRIEGNQDKGESSHYPSYRRTADTDRAHSDSFRLTRSRLTQLSSGSTPFSHQQISGQELPFFTIPGSFQENIRIQWQKQDIFQPRAERVRPNDPEAFGVGERSTQEPEIVVNISRISSSNNRNITPTQNEHNAVTHESSLNSDALWLQISQFAEKTKTHFSELQAIHEMMKTLKSSMDKTVKALQEGHAQLRKPSYEANKRLNQVFEEQHHCKRDRDCLDQDINKLFNVYQSMKPQPQGHVLDNPSHQEDIKPDVLLENETRSPSQYQDGDRMSYSEKAELKEASRSLTLAQTL